MKWIYDISCWNWGNPISPTEDYTSLEIIAESQEEAIKEAKKVIKREIYKVRSVTPAYETNY